MKPTVTMREALNDPQLLGNALQGDSFLVWRILLIAAMGEALTDAERVIFKKFTGREREPLQRVSELAIVGGRRGGKSRALATFAAYVGGLCDWRDVLVPGEVGVLLVLAQSQHIAKQILNYTEADFDASPILSQLVTNRTADAIELKHNIRIEVRPASMKKLRGPSYVAVLLDEISFFFTEKTLANPDTEIIAACSPGLLTTHGMMVMASSPYARKGVLWTTYQKHFGPNGAASVLVAHGTTRDFNPTIPQAEIDRLVEKDPIRNRAEYLAEFRSDLQTFVSSEIVEACIAHGIHERAPERGVTYWGFCDPSGGSSDSFTMCVGHMPYAQETIVVDCLREARPPFSPEAVVKEYSDLFKSYGISTIFGDRYAGIWPTEVFAKQGIRYEQNAAPKSDLYIGLLPLINSCRIELLDNRRCIAQLCNLERRTARGGRDSIDHPQGHGQHDDLINAVAGLVGISIHKYGSYDLNSGWLDDDDDNDTIMRARRLREARAHSHWDTEFDQNGNPMVSYASQ
jgi:hypothetical protein